MDVQHLRGRGWLEDEFEKTVGVIGTAHGAGSVTGFFTKYGDGGAYILPLFGLNKRQNRAPLSAFNLARGLVKRGPPAVLNLSAPTHRASAYWQSEVTRGAARTIGESGRPNGRCSGPPTANLTWYRIDLIGARTAEKNRGEKLL